MRKAVYLGQIILFELTCRDKLENLNNSVFHAFKAPAKTLIWLVIGLIIRYKCLYLLWLCLLQILKTMLRFSNHSSILILNKMVQFQNCYQFKNRLRNRAVYYTILEKNVACKCTDTLQRGHITVRSAQISTGFKSLVSLSLADIAELKFPQK